MAAGGAFRTAPGRSDAARAAACMRLAAELRRRHNLCGHVHLLEQHPHCAHCSADPTRAQALMARQFLPSGSAVRHLDDCGFLQGRGTSLEQRRVAAAGAVVVHNPLSNLRLPRARPWGTRLRLT
eukprot:gene44291-41701_t